MFKVLVPLWIDGFGPFAEGSEQAFDGVPVDLIASMVDGGQVAPLSEWQPPAAPEVEAVEEVEMHPHHVGDGPPAPGTWEYIRAQEKPAKGKKAEE